MKVNVTQLTQRVTVTVVTVLSLKIYYDLYIHRSLRSLQPAEEDLLNTIYLLYIHLSLII